MTLMAQKDELRRIHIIGGPASGKTVLAQKLGATFGIPVYQLDQIAFEGLEFTKRPLETRLDDVRRIAAQHTWVTEGIFIGWIDELLGGADTIIWLDCVSWHVAVGRILVRFARWGLDEAKRQTGARKFTRFNDYIRNLRQLLGVIVRSRRYYCSTLIDRSPDPDESRAATEQQLKSYGHKVIHCCNMHDVQECITSIMAARDDRSAGKRDWIESASS
jgi:adenylate kinase family enzyme